MKTGFFTDENGIPSSTRLTGFISSIALIGADVLNIHHGSDWKLALVSCGVLAIVTIACYYLRNFTLNDVANVAKAIKKGE